MEEQSTTRDFDKRVEALGVGNLSSIFADSEIQKMPDPLAVGYSDFISQIEESESEEKTFILSIIDLSRNLNILDDDTKFDILDKFTSREEIELQENINGIFKEVKSSLDNQFGLIEYSDEKLLKDLPQEVVEREREKERSYDDLTTDEQARYDKASDELLKQFNDGFSKIVKHYVDEKD